MNKMSTINPIIRVIDDDLELCEAQKYFFKFEGLECLTYNDPVEFLENDDFSRPGCIVLDIEMPRMTGAELQQKMLERMIDLPIIFLSAHGNIPLAINCVQKGAFDFLEKPLNPEKQLKLVKEAISKNLLDRKKRNFILEQKELYDCLTPTEKNIALYVSKGYRNKEISEILGVGESTVKTHRKSCLQKLSFDNTIELHDFLEFLARERLL